jgi:hypothetical protein
VIRFPQLDQWLDHRKSKFELRHGINLELDLSCDEARILIFDDLPEENELQVPLLPPSRVDSISCKRSCLSTSPGTTAPAGI